MNQKSVYSYLLVTLFIISLAALNTYVRQSVNLSAFASVQIEEKYNNDFPQDEFYFSNPKETVIFPGIVRIKTGIFNPTLKVEFYSYSFSTFCISQLITQQISSTKSFYILFCSKKESKGHLYALCKLLI